MLDIKIDNCVNVYVCMKVFHLTPVLFYSILTLLFLFLLHC